MEKENAKKINILNIIIPIILIIVISIVAILGSIFAQPKSKPVKGVDNIEKIIYEDKEYYIIKGDYNGEYSIHAVDLYEYWLENFNDYDIYTEFYTQEVMDFKEYVEFIQHWNIEQDYYDLTKNYIVIAIPSATGNYIEARLADIVYENSNATVYLWDNFAGYFATINGYVLIAPVSRDIKTIKIQPLYTQQEFNNIKNPEQSFDPGAMLDKPIIYLYPEEETEISVILDKPKNILHSYPQYTTGWNVFASPSGDLIDLKTGKNLYSLYYEAESDIDFRIKDDGFVVNGKETATFLEEKLAILGLNDREAEEFIIYWLPILESNNYNYIRFATIEEIEKAMPLTITPAPDTTIRILMTFKSLEEPIKVKEQTLTPVQRNGYTVVEWGGSKIK